MCVCVCACVVCDLPMCVLPQVTHKLLLRALASLKSGVTSGSAEGKTGGNDGMVTAMLEMASFCDRQLRLSEEEGVLL